MRAPTRTKSGASARIGTVTFPLVLLCRPVLEHGAPDPTVQHISLVIDAVALVDAPLVDRHQDESNARRLHIRRVGTHTLVATDLVVDADGLVVSGFFDKRTERQSARDLLEMLLTAQMI